MMKVREDTLSLFIQNKNSVTEYYKERKLNCKALEHVILKYPFGLLTGATFCARGEPYEVSHFLTVSEIQGYDIRKVNKLFDLDNTDEIAVAMLVGDDLLCCNVESGDSYVWLIQTGEGEKLETGCKLEDIINGFSKMEDSDDEGKQETGVSIYDGRSLCDIIKRM